MEEQLISFETAKLAKEKGFDWKVISSYRDGENYKQDLIKGGSLYNMNSLEEQHLWKCKLYSAPTQSLLQKWLREEHRIFCDSVIALYTTMKYNWFANYKCNGDVVNNSGHYIYNTYEEALEIALMEGLKLINQCK